MTASQTTARTLTDVARRIAPHLRIISASHPVPPLRTHNVVAIADSAELGRDAVLALEPVEHEDDKLGIVVMGSPVRPGSGAAGVVGADPEGVVRQVAPRIVTGGAAGAILGALVIGIGAAVLGARGWELLGAGAAGAALIGVFGAIWMAFAGFGGSDAYRQTFVDEATTDITIVSVHTDDPSEADDARDRLRKLQLRVIDLDRFGHTAGLSRRR